MLSKPRAYSLDPVVARALGAFKLEAEECPWPSPAAAPPRNYTHAEKIQLVTAIHRCYRAGGKSLRAITEELGTTDTNYQNWLKAGIQPLPDEPKPRRLYTPEVRKHEPVLRMLATKNLGMQLLLEADWRDMGIGEALVGFAADRRFEFDFEQAVFAMVLNRLCDPLSKNAYNDWVKKTGFLPEAEGWDVDQFYRAMDVLHENWQELEPYLDEAHPGLSGRRPVAPAPGRHPASCQGVPRRAGETIASCPGGRATDLHNGQRSPPNLILQHNHSLRGDLLLLVSARTETVTHSSRYHNALCKCLGAMTALCERMLRAGNRGAPAVRLPDSFWRAVGFATPLEERFLRHEV